MNQFSGMAEPQDYSDGGRWRNIVGVCVAFVAGFGTIQGPDRRFAVGAN